MFRGHCSSSTGEYRHVYRKGLKRWEAYHPEHGRAYFTSELAAAKHVAALLHVSIASLRKVQVSRSPRKFKHVFWHAGRNKWVAKPPGFPMSTCDESGSCFTSQDHAARFVVKQLGLASVQVLTSMKRPRVQESKGQGVHGFGTTSMSSGIRG